MTQVDVGRAVLEANQRLASQLRRRFRAAKVKVMNLISSPGAGKTSLLEQTFARLRGKIKAGVIEGDVQSQLDAERIKACGVNAVQIETMGACHLDGAMVERALMGLNLDELELVVIENVGNLVCPVEFDLGEDIKVGLLSVAEGDDKPLKYPQLFRRAGVVVINKTDLLGHVDFDLEKAMDACRRLNPHARIFTLSCRSGEGLDEWCRWVEEWVKG